MTPATRPHRPPPGNAEPQLGKSGEDAELGLGAPRQEPAVPSGYKQTEVGIIPEDWEVKRLGEMSQLITKGTTPTSLGKDFVDSGITFLKVESLNDSGCFIQENVAFIDWETHLLLSRSQLQQHDLLISIAGALGRVGVVPKNILPANTNQAFAIVRLADESLCYREYLYYYVKTEQIKKHFSEISVQGAQANLSLKQISDLPICYPGLSEQEAIAGALSDADAWIESLEKLIEKKRAIKQGTMQALLTPPSQPGHQRLPGFEGEWEVKRLGKAATLKARIGWQGLKTSEYLESGLFRLVTGTEFNEGWVDWNACYCVSEARYKQDHNIQLQENDVLVTKDGTIGKVALVRDMLQPATLNSGVFVIRPTNKSFVAKFFYYLLRSLVFTNFLSQLSAGSTINHLYQKDFVGFTFALPPYLPEQFAIAAVLSDMDAEIEAVETKLAKARRIKQGMMQELLTGRVRLV